MSESRRLTAEELLPILTTLIRRQDQQPKGEQLSPIPRCPTCDVPPCELTTKPPLDRVTPESGLTFEFEHCGHFFRVGGSVALAAIEQATAAVSEAP